LKWTIKFDAKVEKSLRKLEPRQLLKIQEYLEVKIIKNPKKFGKPLKGRLAGLWRYRVGDYRIICQLQDDTLLVLIVKIGHRKDIYK